MSYHELDIYQPFEFMKYRMMKDESEEELEPKEKIKLKGNKNIPIGSNPDLEEDTESSSNNTLIGLAVVGGVALLITFLVLR